MGRRNDCAAYFTAGLLIVAGTVCSAAAGGSHRLLPPEAKAVAGDVIELSAQIEDTDFDDSRAVYALAQALTKAEGGAGYFALEDKWETIRSPSARTQILEVFVAWRPKEESGKRGDQLYPRLVDVLNLGVRDKHAGVQSNALKMLKPIAMRDFAEDFRTYEVWYSGAKGRNSTTVAAESAARFVKDAAKAKGEDVRAIVEFIDEQGGFMDQITEVRAAAINAGWLDVLEGWLSGDTAAMQSAMRLTGGVRFNRKELERVIMPIMRGEKAGRNAAVRSWAIALLGDARATWAIDDMLKTLTEATANPDELRMILPAMARALAVLGEAKSIPYLIAAMEAEGTPGGAQQVGVFGLGPLTGVKQNETHDAAWWREWWTNNRVRYAADVRAMEIPAGKGAPEGEKAGADKAAKPVAAAKTPVLNLQAAFDAEKKYALVGMGTDEPAGGHRLVVILPGSAGEEKDRENAKALWESALGKGWLAAAMLSPKADQGVLVDCVLATVADVKGHAEVMERGAMVVGVGPGAGAALSALLEEDSVFSGAVLLGAFDVPKEESLKRAKGKRVWVGQGGSVKAAAVDALTKAGATVEVKAVSPGEEQGALGGAIKWVSGTGK